MKFFKIPGISTRLLQTGFLIKLLAGISVGLIYTYYYTDRLTADTFKFFDDSAILFNSLSHHPLHYFQMLTGIGGGSPELQVYYDTMTNWYDTFSPFNDNRTMIRLNAFLRLFSMGYYYVHVSVVCFLSYIGIIAIVKVFNREFPDLTREVFLIFLLLPSVLFWGSGLLKDALVFFTFGLVMYYSDRLIHDLNWKPRDFIKFILSLFLLMMTKFQVFLISLPLLVAWAVSARFRVHAIYTFSGICLFFFSLLYLVSVNIPGWDLVSLLVQKQRSFLELALISEAGSTIYIPLLEANLRNLVLNAPTGFITCLIRPFITDSGPLLNTISAVENTFILLTGIYCIIHIRFQNFKNKIMPAFCIFYTLFSFTLIGMITPVLGAIVRYKAQALPFLVVLFIIASHPVIKKLVDRFIPKSIV